MSIFRVIIAWILLISVPVTLVAADSTPAILHAQGGVLVNGQEAADSLAVMPGDLLETKTGFAANLTIDGSTVVIQQESLVKYNGDSLTLEHGSVSVGTSKLLRVDVDCLRVIPVQNEWTQYDVLYLTPRAKVSALKLDVEIQHGSTLRKVSEPSNSTDSGIVREGQQVEKNVSDACGVAPLPHTSTNGINTKWLEIGAGGGGAALICLLLCKGKNPPKQLSQSTP